MHSRTVKKQAVAFHSKSSHSVMYRCTFQGFQDTRCIHTPVTNSTANAILSELLISSLAMQQLSALQTFENPFATVLVIKMFLGDMVEPRGWITWNPRTLRYGEYKNTGTGTVYEPNMTDEEAQKYSVYTFINRNGWMDLICIPYNRYV
ncbi:hypothetical protein HID58_028719 [Brassica napus]|uniref:Pectinesterase catalytic domain-containing protein n=1 Tax=Brassica napus TaxID=3708 RepID=A0ABQ8CCK4_BRANA|nr:hypothetical protein HID58_028719 [Brassica napus]